MKKLLLLAALSLLTAASANVANAQPVQLPPITVTATAPTPITVVSGPAAVRIATSALPKQDLARRVVRSVSRRPF